ncbi:hypothetical protein D3C85_1361750 [compost metagenome]
MVHVADRPGENLRGVGASVQGEGQDGAVQCIAEECVEHGLGTHRCDAVNAGVADQQLYIQWRATEQIGIELHRPAHPNAGRNPGNRQRNRHHETEEERGTEQPQRHRQPGDVVAIVIEEGLPVFLQ